MTEHSPDTDDVGLFGPVEAALPGAPEPGHRALEPLTAREKEMLLFEQTVWRYEGEKERAVRDRWDLSTFGYYQVLNRILEKEAALAWDPLTVNRLRDLRARRLR